MSHSAALNVAFTHTSMGLNLAPLYFFQTYLFCTAANNESSCCTDSIPRTIPQPAHVCRKNQSLFKSILIWARTSNEKPSSKSLLMQAVTSLLFLPSFYTHTHYMAVKVLPIFKIRVKSLKLDILLKRMDFKIQSIGRKSSLLYNFITS